MFTVYTNTQTLATVSLYATCITLLRGASVEIFMYWGGGVRTVHVALLVMYWGYQHVYTN